MNPRRAFIAIIAACAANLLVPAQGWAVDPAATAFLQGIYNAYLGQGSEGVNIGSETVARRYFTPGMAALVAKDIREAEESGDVGRLDFDPFINGQDWEVSAVDIRIQDSGPGQAQAIATFDNLGARTSVSYDLVKTDKGWRIGNIRWPDQEDSLRDVLTRPAER